MLLVRRAATAAVVILVLVSVGAGPGVSATGDIGYQDQSFSGTSTPTGTKRAESVLWWNDGSWWGDMWDTVSKKFHIFRLDTATQRWLDTGTIVDSRSGTHADVLWDGTHLYVASHVFVSDGSAAASGAPSYLYRFSYNPATKAYSLDSGFPAQINNMKTETLVIDKDSTGKLWATWQQGNKIYVNRTLNGDDRAWGTPFALPTSDANVTVDDNSAVMAFGGDKIGVMWSNQSSSNDAMFFAVHRDGDPDTTWQPDEKAFSGPDTADDHINLKSLQTDGSGRLFAAIKTSYTSAPQALIMLLVRSLSGAWSRYPISTVADCPNRPIVLIDTENDVLHAFFTAPGPPKYACNSDGGAIYEKTAQLNAPSFPSGRGTPVIVDADSPFMHNVSSTKQNVDSRTGIAVLATNLSTRFYWHAYEPISPSTSGPPDTSITSGPSGSVSATSATFAFTSTVSGSTFQCKLDAAAFAACTSPTTYTGLADGSHTFQVAATNTGGTDQTPASRTWTVDTSAPAAPTISSPPSGSTNTTGSLTLAGTAEASSTVTVYDGTNAVGTTTADAAGAWSKALSGVADGSHSYTAKATDAAGNTSPASNVVAVSVDTVPPDTTITSGPSGSVSSTSAIFGFSSSETGSTFECKLDVASFTACTSSITYSGLADGSHTFLVRATDGAGNTDATPASRTWTVDTTPPDTTITSGPGDPTPSTSASFSFTSSEAGSSFACSLDGAAFSACSSPASSSGLGLGSHTFEVRSTDQAGNTDPTPASSTWTIVTSSDTTPPTVALTAPADGTAVGGAVTISADASDDVAVDHVDFLVAGSVVGTDASAPYSISWGSSSVPDGAVTITARAVDTSSNATTSAGRTVTVDNSPPDTTITSGPSGTVSSTSATFEFGSPDGGSTFECKFDAASFTGCTSPVTYNGLANGLHTFEVRSTDQAGNTDPTPASSTWTVSVGLFSDGFESGNFSAWTSVVTGGDGSAVVQTSAVKTGTYAAQLSETSNTGSRAYARKTFVTPQTDLTVSGDFNVLAEGANGNHVVIFRLLDSTGARIMYLYRQNLSAGALSVAFGTTSGTTRVSTSAKLPLNTWGHIDLHVITAGTGASTIEVRLDGTLICQTTTASLTASGVSTMQIGNDSAGAAFTLAADNISAQ